MIVEKIGEFFNTLENYDFNKEEKRITKPIAKKGIIGLKQGEIKRGQTRSVNVQNLNTLRLIESTLSEALSEILKNSFEHGVNLSINFDDANKTISFINRIKPDDYAEIDFKLLAEKLTTFQEISSKNFNEGLTLVLFFKYLLRVKEYGILGEYNYADLEDSFFSEYSTNSSSHYYEKDEIYEDENGVIKKGVVYKSPNISYPIIKRWNLTLYTQETEDILKTEYTKEIAILTEQLDELNKISDKKESTENAIQKIERLIKFKETHLITIDNLHEKIKRLILGDDSITDPFNENYGILHTFRIPDNFNIRIDDNKIKKDFKSKFPKEISKNIYNAKTITFKRYSFSNDYGQGKFYIEMPKLNEAQTFFILWQMREKSFYQIIDSKIFFNKKAKGFVVITENKQFDGKRRINLISDVRERIDSKITEFTSLHEKESELLQKLERYQTYKESMQGFLNTMLKIPLSKISKVFFNNSIDKEERLIKITNYIHTFTAIFKVDSEIEEEIKKIPLEKFRHPNSNKCPIIMENIDEFKEITEELELDYRKIYPEFRIGNFISMGHMVLAMLNDRVFNKDDPIISVDPDEVSYSQILYSKNEAKVFYPIKNAEYLVNIEWIDAEDITKQEAIDIEFKVLDIAKGFNLNISLEEKEKEIKKEKKKEKKEIEEKINNLDDADKKIRELEDKLSNTYASDERDEIKANIEEVEKIKVELYLAKINLERESINKTIENVEWYKKRIRLSYSEIIDFYTIKRTEIKDLETIISNHLIDYNSATYSLEMDDLKQIKENLNYQIDNTFSDLISDYDDIKERFRLSTIHDVTDIKEEIDKVLEELQETENTLNEIRREIETKVKTIFEILRENLLTENYSKVIEFKNNHSSDIFEEGKWVKCSKQDYPSYIVAIRKDLRNNKIEVLCLNWIRDVNNTITSYYNIKEIDEFSEISYSTSDISKEYINLAEKLFKKGKSIDYIRNVILYHISLEERRIQNQYDVLEEFYCSNCQEVIENGQWIDVFNENKPSLIISIRKTYSGIIEVLRFNQKDYLIDGEDICENINKQKIDFNKKELKEFEIARESFESGGNLNEILQDIKDHKKRKIEKAEEKKKQHEETISNLRTEDLPKRKVDHNGFLYILDVVEKEYKGDVFNLLYFFIKESDWIKYKMENYNPKGITTKKDIKRYMAFEEGMRIITKIAKIEHEVFLVWFWNSDKKAKRGFYIKEKGIVAINSAILKQNNLSQINEAFFIIELLCHELAFDKYEFEGLLFSNQKDKLFQKCLINKVDKKIRAIL